MESFQIDIKLDELDYDELVGDILDDIEFIKGDIKHLLQTKENINVLWGVQPRNLPNIEFLIAIIQIVKFLKRGFTITILLADIHEMLDSPHLKLDIIKIRCNTYIELIKDLVELFDVNPNGIEFIYGSSFQTSINYTLDLYKISSLTTIQQIYHSREIDISKNLNSSDSSNIDDSNKKMTTMLYPILQALDEKYTKCDIFYGSITQKNMCIFSNDLMKTFDNNNTVYLLQDLTQKINISFFDEIESIKNKLSFFELDDINYLNKYLLFPLLHFRNDNILINDKKIDNYDMFIKYINDNNLQISDIVDISTKYLSKHLDKLYNNLLDSDFMKYYNRGWIGITSY